MCPLQPLKKKAPKNSKTVASNSGVSVNITHVDGAAFYFLGTVHICICFSVQYKKAWFIENIWGILLENIDI